MKVKKTEDSINREIDHLEIKLRQKKNELAKNQEGDREARGAPPRSGKVRI